MSADRVDRTRAVTTCLTNATRQTGSQFARDLEKYGRSALARVEMSVDRVDPTRAVTTRPNKTRPADWKSIRERLRKIWHLGFREGRNVGGPTRPDTGRHDPSTKL